MSFNLVCMGENTAVTAHFHVLTGEKHCASYKLITEENETHYQTN